MTQAIFAITLNISLLKIITHNYLSTNTLCKLRAAKGEHAVCINY